MPFLADYSVVEWAISPSSSNVGKSDTLRGGGDGSKFSHTTEDFHRWIPWKREPQP
jgi:hypothetical protein